MTQDEKRIKIAGACGLPVDVCKCGDSEKSHRLGHNEHSFTPMCDLEDIPDYFNDLNAMREAEEVAIIGKLQIAYQRNLFIIAGHSSMMPGLAYLWHAKAAQRAEAFGLTLNLWTE